VTIGPHANVRTAPDDDAERHEETRQDAEGIGLSVRCDHLDDATREAVERGVGQDGTGGERRGREPFVGA
jgi:hypothetical protein